MSIGGCLCALRAQGWEMCILDGWGIEYVHFLEKNTFCNPAAKGRKDTPQLTYIPQLLAEYIQYQYINSNDIYSPMYIFVLDMYCQQLYGVFVYQCICAFENTSGT